MQPQYRLAGIGTKLIGVLRQRFQDAGITTIRTMLQIDDHLLMSFFRSHGMTAGPFVELEMLLEARSKPNIQGEQRKQLEQRIEKLRKPVHFLHYAGLGLTLFGGIGLAVSLLSYALLAYAR